MHEIKASLKDIQTRIEKAYQVLNPPLLTQQIKELEDKTIQPDFWKNQNEAKKISQKLSFLLDTKNTWEKLNGDCQEMISLSQMIDPEKDPASRDDLKKAVDQLAETLKTAEIKVFLNGPYDQSNAILSLHVGTGGTDAHDWASMLLRMYLRYFEQKNFKAEILEKSLSEEAGLKSATIKVTGPLAYGYLKEEAGVHRLVRLSPFNVGHTRETSFALVEVIPELEEEHDFEIKADDLRIDIYAASGPGGQSVNTSNSAVRITHLPTNLVATCQNERSQLQNKEQALKIIKGRLIKLKEKKRAKTIEELKGEHQEISFSSQIRSYVLHPYQLVKDHRTDFETSQVEKMLDGELLDLFIEASLEKRANDSSVLSSRTESEALLIRDLGITQ